MPPLRSSAAPTSPVVVASGRIVTLAELEAHDGSNGRLWTAYFGEVYDITDFAKSHPGGEIINLCAGRESAALIEPYHTLDNWPKVQAALQYRCPHIGRLENSPAKPSDEFFQTVRKRVEESLAKKGYNTRSLEALQLFECFVTLGLYLLSSYYLIVYQSIFAAIASGLLTGRLGFLMHMGNHMAVSRSPIVNQSIGYLMNVIGSSHFTWQREHQVSHHMNPNEAGKDNDYTIGTPLLRLSKELPPARWWHRWQVPIMLVLMSFNFFRWYISDTFVLFTKSVGSVKFHVPRKHAVMMLASKVGFGLFHMVLPVYLHGPGAIALLALYLAVGGHYLQNTFIVNHIQAELEPNPLAHWADKNLTASANWQTGSLWWNWVSGGLNHQIEHHLFPAMSYYMLPLASPIVRQTCAEFGYKYHEYPSWSVAWMTMAKHLNELGKQGKWAVPDHAG